MTFSPQKLRGGFYTPDTLTDLSCMRLSRLNRARNITVLEPSAGDGAFIRGMDRSGLGDIVAHLEAVELDPDEAGKAGAELSGLNIPGTVVQGSFLEWWIHDTRLYDAVLANPPYLRFQLISAEDKLRAAQVLTDMGLKHSGVANLWIPVFLGAVAKLRMGGVFSAVLPLECLSGSSAGQVRSWLIANTEDLTIDLCSPKQFPGALQEVLIVSGRRIPPASREHATVTFHDHVPNTSWECVVRTDNATWTHCLLSPQHRDALHYGLNLPATAALGTHARFSTSTLTGASAFFCVPSDTVETHHLQPWALPLLSRLKHAPGLIYTHEDQQQLHRTAHPSWMLSFAESAPDPLDHAHASSYLDTGTAENIHQRYKCRIRSPWFRVPVADAGELLLTRRADKAYRMIHNTALSVTAESFFRGRVLPSSPLSASDIVTVFHNSLTLFTAELEGRSFGGGVLELVPREAASLTIPVIPGAGRHLPELDAVARKGGKIPDIVAATDQFLTRHVPGLDPDMLASLHDARHALMQRRRR